MSENQKTLLQQALDMLEEQALHIEAPMLPAGEELLKRIRAAISQQAEPAQCTNEDSWNCKYCRNTDTCEALADKRNFDEPTAAQTEQQPIGYACQADLEWEDEPIRICRERFRDWQLPVYAAPIAQTEQQPTVPESWWQLIHNTLRNYRMGTLDDGYGGGYPLIDAMTADGQPVSGGIQECIYLADEIWNALRVAPIAQTEQQPAFLLEIGADGEYAVQVRDKDWLRSMRNKREHQTHNLYAAPIAQTAPRCEQPDAFEVARHSKRLVEQLRAENTRLKAECEQLSETVMGQERVIEALEPDARRYRTLRQMHWNEGPLAVVQNPQETVKLGVDCPSGERLDQMLDQIDEVRPQ